MSHRHDAAWLTDAHVHGVGGLGVLGSAIPGTGDHGASILYNDVDPGEENSEFRALILTKPVGGTLFFYEDGGFEAAGFADGVHSGTYEGFKDGQSYGAAGYSFQIGLSEIAGTVAVQESGADTASIAGALLVSGALAAAESGADSAAVAGAVVVQGALASTETGTDTAAIIGSERPTSTGTLAAVESGADSASVTGSVLVRGLLAAVDGADSASMAGQIVVSGVLAAVEIGQDSAQFLSRRSAMYPLAGKRQTFPLTGKRQF